MAGMLLQDWAPLVTLPPASTLFGWPPHLVRQHDDESGTFYWQMHEDLAGTETQWKGVVSWMMGIIGARLLLREEGYRWIAPVSAFRANARHPARLTNWLAFEPGAILTRGHAAIRENGHPRTTVPTLRPDYLAVRPRPAGGVRSWASAEAKGTKDALHTPRNSKCREEWRRQAWNLIVTFQGTGIRVPRRIVAATRVNPNAPNPGPRSLHVRGWNSADPDPPEPPAQLATEIAAAHLFGLCMNLGLPENAQAIAAGVEARSRAASAERRAGRKDLDKRGAESRGDESDDAEALASAELQAHAVPATGDGEEALRVRRTLVSSLGSAEVTIEAPTVRLIEQLRSGNVEEASAALDEADRLLDELLAATPANPREGTLLPDGLRVRFISSNPEVNERDPRRDVRK
ncbi:MAG TPA: hypothetical protein VEQ60_14855 [Longimicrobium sp.]|nr:hypothetical protein [Longimicrobium sp.]